MHDFSRLARQKKCVTNIQLFFQTFTRVHTKKDESWNSQSDYGKNTTGDAIDIAYNLNMGFKPIFKPIVKIHQVELLRSRQPKLSRVRKIFFPLQRKMELTFSLRTWIQSANGIQSGDISFFFF